MKFTLSWLRDHLDTTASLDTIVETLTRIGLEVEAVDDPAKALSAFTIAHVISAEQHPNADKLRVCMVDTGDGVPVQVVCGAPNARAGMKSVFSPPGTFIPGKNVTIGKGTIRGVESNGMLCSAAELQLSDDHDGIIDLLPNAPVGVAYVDYAGVGDPVIEINLTPNRPDATGVHGIARDLAAAGLGTLRHLDPKGIRGEGPSPVQVTLDLTDNHRDLCPAFALRLVRGVRNGPSPDWMQRRLKAIGLRPINALVDITNYVTFDRGRPLHVFDAAKVSGHLVVRRAQNGEEILALDGRTYTLDNGMVVIADDAGVESIAGIMGGERTGCDEGTTDVLVESALWDPLNIALTGRKLGINSDARYRFERGVDPAFCIPGAELATKLILDLCGGTPSELQVAGEVPAPATVIEFPWSEVKRLTGLTLLVPEMRFILQQLGFWISGTGEKVRIATPSWRPDVHGKADLVEEIVRIAGLDRVEAAPLPAAATVNGPVLTLLQNRTRRARRLLAGRGLVEAVTWSFVSHREAGLFGGGASALALSNPIAVELSDMRPSLLPGLLAALGRNADRGFRDTALFEVGQVFRGSQPEDQKMAAAAVRSRLARADGQGRHWSKPNADVDVYDAKSDALALLASVGVSPGALQTMPGAPDWYHPGRSGTLRLGPQVTIGYFGELHPRVLEALGLEGPMVAMELVLDSIPAPKARPTRMRPKLVLPDLQPVTRDFAFVVKEDIAADEVLKAARAVDRTLITDVTLFDVYRGAGIASDSKSLALEVILQPTERTLTDAEIETLSERLVADVGRRTGGTLRR